MAIKENLWVGRKRDGSYAVVKESNTKHDSGAYVDLKGPFRTRRGANFYLDCFFAKKPLPSIKECEKLSLVPEEYR